MLADQSRERIRTRVQRTLALHESDPLLGGHESRTGQPTGTGVVVSFVALEDLIEHGPFAPIFISPEHPSKRVNWLGECISDRAETGT